MQILLAVEMANEFRGNERSLSRTAEHTESVHDMSRGGSREAIADQIGGCSAERNSSALGILLYLLQNIIINGQGGAHYAGMMSPSLIDVNKRAKASIGPR